MKSKILSTFLTILLFSNSMFSQSREVFGISGSIQSSQLGLLFPIRVKENFILAPSIDLKIAENIGSDLSIGLAPRFLLRTEKLCPYIGLKFGALINVPSSENSINLGTQIDILTGIAFGAEYFLADKFSVGIEAQGNFVISDKQSYRFGNPDGKNFNTATVVMFTIYL